MDKNNIESDNDLKMKKRNDSIKIVNVHGHYEMFVNGTFFCSGDTYKECADEYEASL